MHELTSPAEQRLGSGALVAKRVTNTFVTFLCESVPGSRTATHVERILCVVVTAKHVQTHDKIKKMLLIHDIDD